MRLGLIIIALSVFGTQLCLGQRRAIARLPEFKENKTIDNVMNAIIDRRAAPTAVHNKSAKPLKDSCFYINFTTPESDIAFMTVLSKDKNNRDILLNQSKNSLGYFFYRGLVVFVEQNNEYDKFFTKTGKSLSFSYNANAWKNMDVVSVLTGCTWYYDYKKGKFFYRDH